MKITCCWMYAIDKYGYPPSIKNMLTAIREMAGMGFEYVELEGFGYENLQQVINSASEIKSICMDEGLKVSNFAVLLPDMISMDPDVQQSAFDMFKRGVDAAAIIGSPYVWIDSFAPPVEVTNGNLLTNELIFGKQIHIRIPATFSWKLFWDNFVNSVIRCTEIVKSNGMSLLIEPRVGEVTPNSDALIRLGEAVNDEHFGVIFDTAHLHAQKELLPLSVHKLGKLLRYVHVADNDGRDNRHFLMGNGNIDWDSVFESLKQIGFNGFFAVDLEKDLDLDEKFIGMKRILDSYAQKFGF
ncbi:MAG: sugar phosphate isomerase/epimerase [Desulfobacterales bacterium]|nr:sugar phosphate isomerase/epimerase [Desulfobacterales bacterium]